MEVSMNTSHTVLVIDDNEALRDVISTVLSRRGFQTLIAEDGAEGLRLAQAHSPSLILCDNAMPGVTGTEVVARLRQEPNTREIPILFMSGATDAWETVRGFEDVVLLQKPFTPHELVRVVQAACGGISQSASPSRLATRCAPDVPTV